MWRRLLDFESWHALLPVASFLFFMSLFLFVLIAVWRMKKTRVEELSHLPLNHEEKPKG